MQSVPVSLYRGGFIYMIVSNLLVFLSLKQFLINIKMGLLHCLEI